jgi:hypothetical protein
VDNWTTSGSIPPTSVRSSDAAAPDPAVEANARITGSMGAVLFVLLAAEGATIPLGVRAHLSAHVFIGLLLVPPVVVKLVSTSHRVLRYYRADPRYVHRGPPPLLLRLIGPLVVISTVAVIVTGIADLVFGPGHGLTALHKLCFVGWFVLMAVHVLGHLSETPRLALADWSPRAPRIAGRVERRLLVVASVVAGLVLGWWALGWIGAGWSQRSGR